MGAEARGTSEEAEMSKGYQIWILFKNGEAEDILPHNHSGRTNSAECNRALAKIIRAVNRSPRKQRLLTLPMSCFAFDPREVVAIYSTM